MEMNDIIVNKKILVGSVPERPLWCSTATTIHVVEANNGGSSFVDEKETRVLLTMDTISVVSMSVCIQRLSQKTVGMFRQLSQGWDLVVLTQ